MSTRGRARMERMDAKINKEKEWKLPLMLRLKGTVLVKIWWQVLGVGFYTAGIVYLHKYVDGFNMNFPLSLVSILGVVLGLLLVFRNNSAYERYWEGRKLWSQMALNIRNLTRCIWVNVEEKQDENENAGDILIEKVTAINLLITFAYAVKNYLREEYLYDEDNIKDYTRHLPRIAPPSDLTVMATNSNPADGSTNRKSRKKKQYNFKAYDIVTPTNIPLEVIYLLSSYVNDVSARKLCESSAVSPMNACLSSLVDCLTSLERILRTPIPLAYSVHLHHSLWLYLLALPFQLVGNLNWFTIPAVVIASFALLGLLIIGWEIENPFGYDENDLPLDEICYVIRTEAETIMSKPVVKPESWIKSTENYPCLPQSQLGAIVLAKKSVEQIRIILARRTALDQDAFDEPILIPRITSSSDGNDRNSLRVMNGQELRSMLNKDAIV